MTTEREILVPRVILAQLAILMRAPDVDRFDALAASHFTIGRYWQYRVKK